MVWREIRVRRTAVCELIFTAVFGSTMPLEDRDDGRLDDEHAWDDVNNIALPLDMVKKARQDRVHEVENLQGGQKEEAWKMTCKAPTSTKWVDTDKTHGIGTPIVRSRWVVPRLQGIQGEGSRGYVQCHSIGKVKKTMFLDIKKAHLAPLCQIDVYVDGTCVGRALLRFARSQWVQVIEVGTSGFRAQGAGHDRGHSVDFIWESCDDDVNWALTVLEEEHELKYRGRLGLDANDVRKIDMLGRTIEFTDDGITRSGDPRHQKLLEEYFGIDNSTNVLNKNGNDEDDQSEQDDDTSRRLSSRPSAC